MKIWRLNIWQKWIGNIMTILFSTEINQETKLNVIKLEGGKYRIVLMDDKQIFSINVRDYTELSKVAYRLSELENNILVGLDDTIR